MSNEFKFYNGPRLVPLQCRLFSEYVPSRWNSRHNVYNLRHQHLRSCVYECGHFDMYRLSFGLVFNRWPGLVPLQRRVLSKRNRRLRRLLHCVPRQLFCPRCGQIDHKCDLRCVSWWLHDRLADNEPVLPLQCGILSDSHVECASLRFELYDLRSWHVLTIVRS
jgi:hypothetical protein